MLKFLLVIVAFLSSAAASESILSVYKREPERCVWGTVNGLWDGFVTDKTIGVNAWDTFTSVGSPLLVTIPLVELKTIPDPALRMSLIIHVLPLESADPPSPEDVLKGSTIEVKIYGKSPFGENSEFNRFEGRLFRVPAWSEGGILDIDLEWLRKGADAHGDVNAVTLEIQGTNGSMITTATGVNKNEDLRPGILACP